MTRSLAALATAVITAAAHTSGSMVLTQRQAYLMGTSVELTVFAHDRAEGLERLDMALTDLEATDDELSTWKDDSDISAINRLPIGRPQTLRPPLCTLLGELEAWRVQTGGAFDPGIGALTSAWGLHSAGRVPTAIELEDARKRSGLQLFDIDGERCTIVRHAEATIDAGAFGKGEALDRARAALGAASWMIDLGGQVAARGAPPGQPAWTVRIAHPADRGRSVMTVRVKAGSLSTSGGSDRDQHVEDTRIGHILDPRTGAPATYQGAVVVWHDRGLIADILSTALHVMGPAEGARWAESRGIAAAYLIPAPGTISTVATSAFARLEPSVTD